MAENSIAGVLQRATTRLAPASDSARLDAEVLLARVLGRGRASLRAYADERVDPPLVAKFEALVSRRAAGEPVAYLLGEREFWSLALEVAPGVLIPRPDTETLVQAALETCGAGPRPVADLGTGSGAVALALAIERTAWTVTATDVDDSALGVARRNAARLRVDNVRFILGDWCAALAGARFDLIVSNPPYVRDGDPHLDRGDLRFEPRHALAAGPDGLDAIRAIASCAPRHLSTGGWLLLEHGFDQADAVAAILRDNGFDTVRHWHDLNGHTRVTGGRHGRA